jgi:hypothetical protein
LLSVVDSLAMGARPSETAISLAFLMLFLLSLGAGIGLLRGKEIWLVPSLWLQAVQVPDVALGPLTYFFASGSRFAVGLRGLQIVFEGAVGSSYRIGWSPTNTDGWEVKVNVVALAAFIALSRVVTAHAMSRRAGDEQHAE